MVKKLEDDTENALMQAELFVTPRVAVTGV